jgi:CheY-like chemotaxis protein
VVLCDLRMPGMSGHEFYRRLQASRSPAMERLVFMTGDVLSPEASRFLQEAARPVLSKPFTLSDLTEVLGQVVG